MSKIFQSGVGPSASAAPTAPFPFAPNTLTYGSTVTIDAAQSDLYHLTLTGSGASIAKPTNLTRNARWILAITQDATGSRTLVGWNAVFDFGVAGVPILTTAANATDYFACIYWPASGLYSGSAEAIHVLAQSPGF